MKGKAPTEEEIQIALFEWMAFFPLLRDVAIHIPNGGKRNAREGAKFKRLGVKAGVSDIFLPLPTKSYHGLWVELKRDCDAKVSPAQFAWLAKMTSLGYRTHIAFGFDDAKSFISNYITEFENSH